MTALRLFIALLLLAVPAFAQTAATRATLYTEIDTLFADTGSDPITPAQLRTSLKNITASSYNGLTDGVVSSTYLPLTGGTLTGELMINPSGSASLNAYDKLRVHQAYTTLPNNSTEGNFVVFLTTGAGASSGTTPFRSFLNYVTVNGAYSAAEATGAFDNVINAITDGTKTLALLKGHDVAVRSSSAGLTTDAIAYNAMPYVTGAGSWTNYFAYRSGSPSLTSTGTIGTAYGLYLYKQKVTGVTTGYGVYQADAADINYFAGAVTLGSTINKLTLTAPATGSTLTIADGKTLTASNTVTLTATDGSTLAIGGGGTLGTAAYTASSAYATSAQGTKADNVGAVNGIVKSNGSASFSAASAGTDYVVPAGNVATATALATPRTIGNVSFDGTANIVPETSAVVDSTDASSYPLMVDSATGSLQPKTDAGLTYNATTGALTATGFAGPLTGNVTGNVTGSSGSTTGNAATATALATPRAIYGNNFDGSAALTQVIASTYGGTGNGFAKFSGPTTSEKTFTLPDATATILTSNAAVTVAQGGTGATTLTANNVILGNGTTAVQFVAPGSSGNVLTSNGTTWTSAAPSGGSGDVATDTIWDAKGDLAGGTGANTAARLAVGTNDYVLTAASGEATGLKWAAVGNAATATALQTARTIGNVSFDGTAAIVPETVAVVDSTDSTSYVLIADSATGSLQPKTDAGITYNASTGALNATALSGTTLTTGNLNLIGASSGYSNTAAAPVYIVPVATADSGAAQAISATPELVAVANSDQLYGTTVGSKITSAAKTGLTTVNLFVSGQTLGGGGSIDTAYQLYMAAGPTATTRYGIYQAGSSDKNYFAGTVQTGGTIELGAATDTTLARSAAGVVTVEGATVVTTAPSTSGNVLTSNGSAWVSSTPTVPGSQLMAFFAQAGNNMSASSTFYVGWNSANTNNAVNNRWNIPVPRSMTVKGFWVSFGYSTAGGDSGHNLTVDLIKNGATSLGSTSVASNALASVTLYVTGLSASLTTSDNFHLMLTSPAGMTTITSMNFTWGIIYD